MLKTNYPQLLVFFLHPKAFRRLLCELNTNIDMLTLEMNTELHHYDVPLLVCQHRHKPAKTRLRHGQT